MPYLLRVELPDVPGSLGRVAAAIGEAGGDIEAIEIVEHRHEDSVAVDDVLLETAPGVMPDSVVSACSELDGVRVLWISRYAAGGNLFLDLEAVEAMSEEPTSARDQLVELLPVTFRADWGVRLSRSGELLTATSAAPELLPGEETWPAPGRAARLDLPDSHPDVVIAVASLGDDEVVLFARRGGPDILDSELARFRHLAALADSISRNG